MAQNYHFLSAPLDLSAKYGVPLRLMLACILECVLSLLHLHGFHTFVTCVSPALIYPTFYHIITSPKLNYFTLILIPPL